MPRRRAAASPAASPQVEPGLQVPEGRSTLATDEADSYLPGVLGKVSDYLFKISTLQIFLGALMLMGMLGRHTSAKAGELKQYTELPILTNRISYSPRAIADLFDALGEEGREAYHRVNVQSTLLLPLSVAFALSVSIGRVSDAAGFGHAWNLFPFVIVAVATVENLLIAALLHQYPEQSELLATVCGLAASFKWRLLMYSAFSSVLGIGWILAQRIRSLIR